MGDVIAVDAEKSSAAKSAYVKQHPKSQQWVEFGDFAMYQLEIIDVYMVAGFGAMGWIKPDQLKS